MHDHELREETHNLFRLVFAILQRQNKEINLEMSDISTVGAALDDFKADITAKDAERLTQLNAMQAEIEALQGQANPDLSGLATKLADLRATYDADQTAEGAVGVSPSPGTVG